ncbi:MAG: mandelate racemase/muconate lactonizing enzyme family protein [Bryobacteraceae bacterium]|nr:mandelate racemase/muconate lactonizing enzyme family protein [Bryobacterales bacterium]MEB2362071.1 mandelate racemase/muconate lactonizing enzyme family protein [Bryobacterales bacterium]NUN03199.1 mandelate racemase/muconate lactonizing enzyme family protein [Bryobacteraceae bacterium]
MKSTLQKLTGRRSFLTAAGGALGTAFWADDTLDAATQHVNTRSKPSELKITDLRVAVVARAPMTCPVIRIDTNQGISGLGEVRDGASKTYALMLKSRLLGENPCNVDKIFRKIKQFGGHARQGGGVCGVEMALWDLAGKAYNVPVYQMLGGKFRDRIRCYADTTSSHDPKVYGERMKKRMEQGFTFLKMDLGANLVEKVPGALTRPLGSTLREMNNTQHMFTGIELTDKGIAMMADYAGGIRDVIGMEVPLAADHFGHIGVNSCIRLGKALEKYNMAWLEDMIPWQHTELMKQITDAVDIPILTGEDIYLKEPFFKLCRKHAVDMIHPDLATSGGILETKKIGDGAQEYGVAMAMHFAGTPVSFMANLHCAAATENFVALEHHSVDVPWWEDLVQGIEKPIVNRGFAKVPEGPGLGITLNDDVMKQHLLEPGYFEPTPEWDKERSHDRQWS